MGLAAAEMADHNTIIKSLRERCHSGRNKDAWHHQFAARKQLQEEPVDNWLCDLRDLAQKCEFPNETALAASQHGYLANYLRRIRRRGAPCHFVVKNNVAPRATTGVQELLMPLLQQELQSLESQGIIRKVTAQTS